MKLEIEKLDYEGRGIAYDNGLVTFIPYALPNEVVECSVILKKKHFQVAKIDNIIVKSSERIPTYCPYFKKCGGCTFAHVTYQNSIKYKKEILFDLFNKNGFSLKSFEIIESRPVLEYRNKVTLHIKDGRVGYFKENTHELVEINGCFLVNRNINLVIKNIKDIGVWNGTVCIRVNYQNEILLVLETLDEVKIPEWFLEKFNLIGIILNHKCVFGKSFLIEKRGDIDYKIHGESFFQINPFISEKIKEDVLSYFGEDDTVFDLYCGIGFFTFPLAKKVKQVVGIEQSLYAIRDALEIKKYSGLSNISFHLGKVENVLECIKIPFQKAIIDPPRSGLQKNVVKYLNDKKIDLLIYISCNPKTLVRDLKELSKSYEVVSIKGYDMFSYTKHVECVCVMTRR